MLYVMSFSLPLHLESGDRQTEPFLRLNRSFEPLLNTYTRPFDLLLTSLSMDDKDLQFGITEFLNEGDGGFDGQLKCRLSDFLVNEVDTNGEMVRLTKLGMEKDMLTEAASPISDAGPLTTDLIELIAQFLTSGKMTIEIPAPDNKEQRRLLHHQLEAHFHKDRLLRTPKKNADGAHVIEISRASGSSAQFRRQEASRNRQSPCDYIHFTLYKENMDTMEAVNNMGGFLRVPPRCIQYAGVKDKRAKTVQRVSIKFRDPQRLAQFSRNSIRIGNFTFEKEPLHLGDLTGNYFQLVIRNVTADEDTIRASTDAFVKQGFVNYFGLQRFGTTEVSTMEVGKALLKADWNAAVEAIMKERSNEHERLQRCRKVWAETKDAEAALKAIGNRSCIEAQLLQGLARNHKNDPFGAIQNIPRNTRLMYVHSYQSYLWNLAVSYRLRTLGSKPAVGDLVVKSSAEPSAKRLRTSEKQEDDVMVVTSDDVEQYSLSDVVMPIPGYDVQYPDNAVSKYLFELMEADGIDLRSKHKVKDYSLAGCYRRVICRPTDASWQIIRYNDVNQDLQLSDLDVLEGKAEEPKKNEGIHTAVAVKFTLPSSTYATMAIREMLKRSSDHKFAGKNLTAEEPLDQDFASPESMSEVEGNSV